MSSIDAANESAVPFQIKSLVDLVRLAFSWAANQQSVNLFYMEKGGKHLLGAIQLIPGYYTLRGLPIFAFVAMDGPPKAAFIKYRIEPSEEWGWADNAADRKYQYLPIIALKQPPKILQRIE